jgi:cation diffusion facilitator CzcD-associated flavoprotein CzcO
MTEAETRAASGAVSPDPLDESVDAVVIGAGFSGLFASYALTRRGLTVRAFDAAADVGGVWYWNRYPGAQTDSPQHTYQYTFDRDLLNEPHYSKRYPPQPEVLRYLRTVADRFGLRGLYRLSTRVTGATFDEDAGEWIVTTDRGDRVRARHLVTGLGLVSEPVRPAYPGTDRFAGRILHTSAWPHEPVDLSGARVALIGTGSSGIQITPQLAAQAAHLTVFQRTPNYVAPTGNRPVSEEDREEVRERYADVVRRVRAHPANFPFEASTGRNAVGSSEERIRETFERMWERGGFSLLYETFDDVAIDPVANEYVCAFIRSKIRDIVDDPATAELLMPWYPYGSKRPPTGDGFYQAFNRPHVDLVSVRETPIVEITERGIRTTEREIPVDVIVFATGFDAGTGSFDRIDIRGRGGRSLREHWAAGPRTYKGVSVSGFPNLLMVAGPQSPFSNLPPGAELAGTWVADFVDHLRRTGAPLAEPTVDAENGWVDLVNEIGDSSFSLSNAADVNSWFTGANVEGKARAYNIFFGGAVAYARHLSDEAEQGYPGFVRSGAPVEDPAGAPAEETAVGR